jgi:NADH-quinone oxidoreductase subunit N
VTAGALTAGLVAVLPGNGVVTAVRTAAIDEFRAPDIDYARLLPVIVVFGVAVLGVLVEALVAANLRYRVQSVLAVVGVLVAGGLVVRLGTGLDGRLGQTVAAGSVAIDGPALFLQGTILALALLSLLLVSERGLEAGGSPFTSSAYALPGSDAEREADRSGRFQTEVYPLMMFAIAGMMVFAAANDLLVMFVALEVFSLPLYLLCGMARRRRLLSQESAMKYFLLGSFSSAFFLYGVALVYGYAGSVQLGAISDSLNARVGQSGLLLAGVGLLSVGLLFKVSAAPFHAWTPDVYQGAPTPITGFMAACTKVAAFGALLRVFYVGLGGLRWDWRPLMIAVAVLTMAIGSVLALFQSDIKRMLAYSSIAHAGFLLTGVVAADRVGVAAVLFYLAAYGFTTIGAFAVVTMVRNPTGEASAVSDWAGLGRRSPLLAGVFALFLLGFAGIPLTSGFTAKFAVFSAASGAGQAALVVVGVLASAVAVFFYARIIVLMFFSTAEGDGPTIAVPSALTSVAVAVGVAATVLLGVLPQVVLNLADGAATLVR